jgi:hypothetical protein
MYVLLFLVAYFLLTFSQYPTCIPHLFHSRYMPCPLHLPLPDHSTTDIIRTVLLRKMELQTEAKHAAEMGRSMQSFVPKA